MRTFLLTLTGLATAAAATLAVAPPAEASFYSQGVKDVDYVDVADSCGPIPIGCTPGAGEGDANVLRITQAKAPDGTLSFDGFATTSADPGSLWMGARLGAECRSGYHLKSATIGAEAMWDVFNVGSTPQEVVSWSGIPVSVPNAKEMPVKQLALDIPMEVAFGGPSAAGPDHFSIVEDFDSLEAVYAHGEQVVADRIASGWTSGRARATDFTVETSIATHADVRCEGNAFGRVFAKRMPRYLPLTIEFEGVAQTPVKHHTGLDYTDAARVTDVSLVVAPSSDPCTIGLYGSITADRDTDVTYRFVDEYGQLSNGFEVHVEADVPFALHHEVAVPEAGDEEPDGPSYAPTPGGGSIDDEAAPASPWETGSYQLRVESPNVISSDIGFFDVDPCVPDPVQAIDLPDVGEAGAAPDTGLGSDRNPGGTLTTEGSTTSSSEAIVMASSGSPARTR